MIYVAALGILGYLLLSAHIMNKQLSKHINLIVPLTLLKHEGDIITPVVGLSYSVESIAIHYNDVTMSVIGSQITSLAIVYSTVYSDADQRTHQSSASLAFVRGIHRRPVSLQWLLMAWFPVSPGPQQTWYWLCEIWMFVSSPR